VALPRYQFPTCRQELRSLDAATLVDILRSQTRAIQQYLCPDDVSVPSDNRVRATKFMRFVWIEGRVNAAEHHAGASFARHFSNLVAPERIRRVDADADDIATLDGVGVDSDQGFIDQERNSE